LASQLQAFFGLRMYDAEGKSVTVPADFLPKLHVLWDHAASWSWQSAAIGAGSLAVLILMRRFVPRIPGAIVVVLLSALAVWLLHWDTTKVQVVENVWRPLVETIGTKFGANGVGGIP